MFVLSNLLEASARIFDIVLTVTYILILARAIISWVNPDPFNPIVQFLYRSTEPILRPIRKFLPLTGIDFSPIIAFLGIVFLRMFLVRTLFDLARRVG